VAEYGACFDGTSYRCEINPAECINSTFVSIYDLPDGTNCNCQNTIIGSCYAYLPTERVAWCVEEAADCPAPGIFIEEDNSFGVNCTCSDRSNGDPSRYGGCFNGLSIRCSLDPSDCSPIETWVHAYDVVQYKEGYCHANETFIGACYDPSVRVARCVPNDASCPSDLTWIPPFELSFFGITCLAEMPITVPENAPGNASNASDRRNLSSGAIAGIVIACLAVTLLVLLCIYWCIKKQHTKQSARVLENGSSIEVS